MPDVAMSKTTGGWILFIAALGMLFGLMGAELMVLKPGELYTTVFAGKMLLHLSTVIAAFVGGKLIPSAAPERDPLMRERRTDLARQQLGAPPAGNGPKFVAVLLIVLLPATAAAAESNPLALPDGTPQAIADVSSWALVGANVAGSVVQAFRADDRGHAFGCLALLEGVSLLGAEGLKRAFPRERPDGSDRKSFPSMHSWLGAVNAGWNVRVGWSMALGAGVGRGLADKHHASDIAFGLGAGALTGRLCNVGS